MKKCLLYAQSGGTTAVINASAAGVIEEALSSKAFDKVFCARYGMHGMLNEDFFDVTELTPTDLDLLANTPASAFGSCRYKLPDVKDDLAVYEKIASIFAKYGVTCFAYNGGNDSMDTCDKISKYFRQISFPCKVVGVPKTVDNDLAGTHYCPGYGSAVKYVATTMQEIALDTSIYEKGRITVCEIMGRDTGWLAAGSAVANLTGNGADLIYLPEKPFELNAFLQTAETVYRKKGYCLVAVSEGIRDENGYVGAISRRDSFNHVQLGGAANNLTRIVTERLGIVTRAIDLNLPQRAAGHIMSGRDQHDARQCGRYAVKMALEGITDAMAAIKLEDDNLFSFDSVCLNSVANVVKNVPDEYISDDGTNVSQKFIDYVLPLIQGEVPQKYKYGLPSYFDSSTLKKA